MLQELYRNVFIIDEVKPANIRVSIPVGKGLNGTGFSFRGSLLRYRKEYSGGKRLVYSVHRP